MPASSVVGVLGAGQLGRMLALAGYPLGLRFVFVDPAPGAPAGQVAEQLVADYQDAVALARLAESSVVTYEFESVPEAAARQLAKSVAVHPPADALATAQDRLAEKTCFRALGIPTPGFAAVDERRDLERALGELGLPAVLKTRRHGYDGKGQRVLRSPEDIDAAWAELSGVPLLVEAFVPFERELSVLAVRSTRGEIGFYPVVENHHEQGLLRLSRAPAPGLSDTLRQSAERHARRLVEHFAYVGVLALELFEAGGVLYANEIAPRVHNSGHWTIEGACTSQFENHLRAILGLPLGSTAALGPSAMVNLIGELPDPAAVLAVPDAHLHVYGKQPRAGRKVGHITLRAASEAEREDKLRALLGLLA